MIWRVVLVVLAVAVVSHTVAIAEPAIAVRRVGVLMSFAEGDQEAVARTEAFSKALASRGWIEGQNLRIERRWAAGSAERLSAYAKEVVDADYDVTFVSGTPVVIALRNAGLTRPVIFVNVADPVGTKLVKTLARPGGNITGFMNFEFSMAGKWLDLLKEVSPSVSQALFIHNPGNSIWEGMFQALQSSAISRGMSVIEAAVRNSSEIESNVDQLAPRSGLIVMPDATVALYRQAIIASAERNRLPAIYPYRFYINSGGLLAYGNDANHTAYQAGLYADRVLRGESVASLPIQAPTKFELLINLKAARSIGLTIPVTLLATADELIE